jgi:hypothetical protein
MKGLILGVAVCALVSGCAKRPGAIAPAAIPFEAYTGLDCSALSAELAKEEANLYGLSASQSDAATGDALGVFVIGVPIASVAGGDKEGAIAVSKGKVEAMKAAKLKNGCA